MSKAPTAISAFFLGGAIPKERVGDVLELLYLTGGTNFQIEPVFDKPERKEVAQQAIEKLLKGEKPPLALPPPKAYPRREFRKVNGRHVSLKEFLLDLIGKAPITHDAVMKKGLKAGYKRPQIGTRLWELTNRAGFAKLANGHFVLTPRGRREDSKTPKYDTQAEPESAAKAKPEKAPAAKAKPEKKLRRLGALPIEGSQEGLIYAELKKKHPDQVQVLALRGYFKKMKLREASVSVALTSLKKRGLIERVSTGAYLYIPQATTSPTREEA